MVDRAQLVDLVNQGLTIRGLAERLDVTTTTVQRWLRRYDLSTQRGGDRVVAAREARASSLSEATMRCPKHGETCFVKRKDGAYRCRRCASEAVVRRRKRIKELLVLEAGGRCAICKYDSYVGALQFHHLDPREKRFGLAGSGLTRSLEAAREEAAKCVLLCANCHAEVEGGRVELPLEFRRGCHAAETMSV